MRNVIILGSARSGTSMVAGVLAGAGYFFGETVIPADERNPMGFLEDREVLDINERLLDQVLTRAPANRRIRKLLFRSRPGAHQGHLAHLPLNVSISAPPDVISRISSLVSKEPFCLKDPRFSWTLPAWRPFLQNTIFICVFRQPAVVADSLLRLDGNFLSHRGALRVWENAYAHIIENHRHFGEWLFVSYDQVLHGDGVARLARFTGSQVDADFPQASLKRSSPERAVRAESQRIYDQLCSLAG